ncbi:hypothetical protein PMAYCL1PPCAC_29677, partial [Pristionchus mayeri]
LLLTLLSAHRLARGSTGRLDALRLAGRHALGSALLLGNEEERLQDAGWSTGRHTEGSTGGSLLEEEKSLLLDALGLAGGHAGRGTLLLLRNEKKSLRLLALRSARRHASRGASLLGTLVAAHRVGERSTATARVLLLQHSTVAVVVGYRTSTLVLQHIGTVALLDLNLKGSAVAIVVVVVDGSGEIGKLTTRGKYLAAIVDCREAALTLRTREFTSIRGRNLLALFLFLLLLFLLFLFLIHSRRFYGGCLQLLFLLVLCRRRNCNSRRFLCCTREDEDEEKKEATEA